MPVIIQYPASIGDHRQQRWV